MWPRQINYGLPADMNNMVGVGLRDLFVVAPPQHNQDSSTISFNPLHSIGNNEVQRMNYSLQTTQASDVGVGVGVGLGVNLIPLLSATPCLPSQQQQARQVGGESDVPNLLTSGGTGACLDCGNQAKKDCSHGRCRTCCKSRGYDCTTHLKSTWIPAASRRRDKHSTSSSGSKKPRLITNCPTGSGSEHTSTSNTTTPTSFDSARQDAGFKESLPEQVQAPAKFKCMRFTAIEDGEDEYAYEALVKIGGHIFKGVLYDKGIAHPKDGIPNIAELHLGGYSGGGVGIGR